jgi:ABC-2 type transport system ATP-binding protein
MNTIIEVRKLFKRYGDLTAVNGISFTIPQGQCLGLLGPNGAGKSTTIEMMEGITEPSSGEILYKGEPQGESFRQEAGIQFQSTALQDFLTVREVLELFASFYQRPVDIDNVVDLCALDEFLQQDNRKLSGGQRQRMLLAIALLNDPEIVFLDEPTTGLDPQARRNFWSLIESIKARGKTVLLTTHYMDEAYQLCDEILIMDHGNIIAQGSPRELLSKHFNDVILQLPKSDMTVDEIRLPVPVIHSNNVIEIQTHDVNNVIQKLLELGISLNNLRIRERNLEDLFIELTGRELRA